jgi:hypothetical protein
VLEVDTGVGLRTRMPPRGNVMAGWIEEGAEPHLALGCHSLSVIALPDSPIGCKHTS